MGEFNLESTMAGIAFYRNCLDYMQAVEELTSIYQKLALAVGISEADIDFHLDCAN